MKRIAFFLLLFLLVPFGSAASTDITVDTLPYTDVTISILQTGDTYYALQSFYDISSGDSGYASATYMGDENEFGIAVYVKVAGETIYYKRFYDIDAGEAVILNVPEQNQTTEDSSETDAGNVPVLNESVEPESVVNATNQTALTGNVIGNAESGSNVTYYVIAAVLIGALVGGFFITRARAQRNHGNPAMVLPARQGAAKMKANTIAPKQSSNSPSQNNTQDMEAKLREAERKIREAQAEINTLKNQDRIKEMEKKLEQDRRELERLKRGQQPVQNKNPTAAGAGSPAQNTSPNNQGNQNNPGNPNNSNPKI